MNVFRNRHVIRVLTSVFTLCAALWNRGLVAQPTGFPGAPLAVAPSPGPDYGTVAESSLFVPGAAFNGARTNITVIDDHLGSATFSGTGADATAWAPANLPQGALITGVDFYYYDSNATDNLTGSILQIPADGSNLSYVAICLSSGSAGWGVATENLVSPWVVDNAANGYVALVGTYPDPVTDTSIRWRGMKVRYKLQVSPAPAVASFTDVPTDYWASGTSRR